MCRLLSLWLSSQIYSLQDSEKWQFVHSKDKLESGSIVKTPSSQHVPQNQALGFSN